MLINPLYETFPNQGAPNQPTIHKQLNLKLKLELPSKLCTFQAATLVQLQAELLAKLCQTKRR